MKKAAAVDRNIVGAALVAAPYCFAVLALTRLVADTGSLKRVLSP